MAMTNFKEDINRIISTDRQLSFVEDFLREHSEAELYLVGGAVRDLLMKRRMLDVDFDFVIRKLPSEQIEKWFGKRGTIDFVGRTFGVYKFNNSIDIALPRTEQAHATSKGGYKEFDVKSDADLPIEDDLSRRDFTMNAMAINMRTSELHDPFGGEADIKQRLIRAVGEPQKRFDDDLSRMLRAIRFAAELHFEIEEKTLEAIKKNIGRINDKTEETYVVPRETIGSELAKALARNPAGAVQWLKETGALEVLFGSIEIPHIKEGNPTLAVVLMLRTCERGRVSHTLSLTGLDTLPRGTAMRIEPEDVLWLIDRLGEIQNEKFVMDLRASTFEKYFMNGRGDLLIQALQTINKTDVADAASDRAKEIRDRWEVEKGEPIPPLLSGNDVLDVGIPAGPKVREMLEQLRDEQLEGRILTREQAKQWLKIKNKSVI